MITASKLALARACPGFAYLPHDNTRTAASDAGTERHAVWEDEIGRGVIPEVLDERYPGYSWRAEVPFVLDTATGIGRELPKGAPRDYGEHGPFCVPGTADAVGIAPDRSKLVICDRKSFDRVEPAAINLQLGIAAVALARAYGIDSVDVGIHYEVEPYDSASFDTFDIDAMAIEIRRVVTNASRELFEGGHCRYCPAFQACPRKRHLALEVITGAADNRLEMLKPATPESAAELYEFTARLRMLLKRADAVVYAFAAETPIPLSNGRMLGRVVSLGNRQLDGRLAHDVIKELHGLEVADKAVTMEATQASIEAALKVALPRGATTSAKTKVMAVLEERGGVTRKSRNVIEEYAAPPQLASARAGAK